MIDFLKDHPGAIVVIGLASYVLGRVIFGQYDPAPPRKWYDLRRIDPRKECK